MDFYQSIALITAGIALAMGLVSLFSGIHRNGEKVDLVFGVSCISLFMYFVLPPAGFVVADKIPYPTEIIIKRFFIFLYVVLTPWFILYYTGYKKRVLPVLINVFLLLSFLLMAFTVSDSGNPLWYSVILLPVGLIAVHSLIAIRHLVKTDKKSKGWWLFSALMAFVFLYLITAINQLGNHYFSRLFHTKNFYPVNLSSLVFILIMGIRLRANAFEKFMLEKILRQRDTRWHSLLEKMQMVVLELDTTGKVTYINQYGIQLLGFSSSEELLETNWFEKCLPAHETTITKSIFLQSLKSRSIFPHYKNDVQTKTGKCVRISWTNLFVYDDEGGIRGFLCLGSDITKEENSLREIEDLKKQLEKENLVLKGELLPDWITEDIVGQSPAIKYAMQKARQVSPANASVMLEGETGVGKELFADLIHHLSLRSGKPFIKVNCGALPAELIEDELFGHEKGAFTGAIQMRKGRFEIANGGTIFLDEIGELPLALQPKLLRVLQNGEFERVGGQQTIKVDVRIIAATNRDLSKEVQDGRFREDLYYRLNVFPITIPPLRYRKDDIPLLISFFIERKNKKYNKKIERISKADMQRLCAYAWPGNIRELKNVIERSVISAESNEFKLDWWGNSDIIKNVNHHEPSQSLEDIESEHIIKLLVECNWKISGENGAAEKLGMHPNTLRSRMKKLNITRQRNGK